MCIVEAILSTKSFYDGASSTVRKRSVNSQKKFMKVDIMLWNNNIFVEKFMSVVVIIILGAKMDQCSIRYITVVTAYIKLNYYIY